MKIPTIFERNDTTFDQTSPTTWRGTLNPLALSETMSVHDLLSSRIKVHLP